MLFCWQDMRQRRSEVTVELRKVSYTVIIILAPLTHTHWHSLYAHTCTHTQHSLFTYTRTHTHMVYTPTHTHFPQNRKEEEMLKRRNIDIPEDDVDSTIQMPFLNSFSPEALIRLVAVSSAHPSHTPTPHTRPHIYARTHTHTSTESQK